MNAVGRCVNADHERTKAGSHEVGFGHELGVLAVQRKNVVNGVGLLVGATLRCVSPLEYRTRAVARRMRGVRSMNRGSRRRAVTAIILSR